MKYSLKNIPIPSKKSYQLNLIDKIESSVKRMRWRAFYYLNQQKCDNNIKETFRFKSRKCPPFCSNLITFEKDLSHMVTSLKFSHVKDSFQRELNEDICKIKSSLNAFVFTEKTNNIYEMSKGLHQKLLHDNVTKTYQNAPPKLEASINLEPKSISTKLKISNRVKRIARTPAYVTRKDHKDNFCSSLMYRLINPSKNKVGKVSKQLVENINFNMIEKSQFNQWRNTDAVLKWFNNITDKSNCSLIQFDIKEFYPSITENILQQTLKFAKQDANIDKNELRIINHCRKSLLFSDNKTWKKNSTESCFDAKMGSFDGAEVCELGGLYMQSKLEQILPKSNFGLYRDDGLALLRTLNGQHT